MASRAGPGDLVPERKREENESVVCERGWRWEEEKKGKEVDSLEEDGERGEEGLPGLVEGVVVVDVLVEGVVEEDVARTDIVGRCEDMLFLLQGCMREYCGVV